MFPYARLRFIGHSHQRRHIDIQFSIFAFSTNLTGTGKTEWDRYLEITKETEVIGGPVGDICVAGHGYSYRFGGQFGGQDNAVIREPGFKIIKHDDDYAEVIQMLMSVTTTSVVMLEEKVKQQFLIEDYLEGNKSGR